MHLVPEILRLWCERTGRTPTRNEQPVIAQLQAQAVDDVSKGLCANSMLVADTTPLMTAVYSLHYFDDPSLVNDGLKAQRQFDHTLLMGLDLPWQPDGIQRDGPRARETVDTLLRHHLSAAALPYQVVYGAGHARLACALHALGLLPPGTHSSCTTQGTDPHTMGSRYGCPNCGDPGSERQLFSSLLGPTQTPNERTVCK